MNPMLPIQEQDDDAPNGERISIEQYNKEIEEAEAEIERGKGISHEEVIKISEGWQKNRWDTNEQTSNI
jgi:hypothetical protein